MAAASQSGSLGPGGLNPAYASGWPQISTPRSCTPAGNGSLKRRPRGCSAEATTGSDPARGPQLSRPSGPHTTASGDAVSPGNATSRPTLQAAPRKTGPSQWHGRSTSSTSSWSRPSSSSSSPAALATQLAYVVSDSSVRSPVATS